MAKRLIPSLNRILVEKIVPPSKTSAGILLPEKTTKLNSGKVVAVGPGLHDSNGNHIPVSVKEGDTVLLPEYGGTEVKLGDKEFFKVSKPDTKLSYVWFGDQPFELVLKQYYSGKYGANVHHACVSGPMITGYLVHLWHGLDGRSTSCGYSRMDTRISHQRYGLTFGKSTLACSLSRELHHKGYLTYILDGDNIRHGLNGDLSFNAEDRTENIRRVGEVAKLFADAGVICIASLISPYRKERDACRAIMPDSSFIEVFLNIPLEVCEARDPKGLYRLARAGKIKGFTGIDDPYEPPLNCEITIELEDGKCPTPKAMAEEVAFFLEKNGFLQG
ncbi:hypothetical protein ZIOFF_053458 [Zingiber officinale]|uniref:Adenylyl-sulfate kinase n=2 Tax=Zingiber officinale TaxID=94328 RepID=A0A8J5FGD1_ZINOF|nr:hypothetical protein ZIOFF_053458 [Zingiber officinale]